jgi:hypothetical protein
VLASDDARAQEGEGRDGAQHDDKDGVVGVGRERREQHEQHEREDVVDEGGGERRLPRHRVEHLGVAQQLDRNAHRE